MCVCVRALFYVLLNVKNSSASMVNSPYLYPFQTMVSPDAAVYGSNSQVYQPNPELNECAVVDPSSVEVTSWCSLTDIALILTFKPPDTL